MKRLGLHFGLNLVDASAYGGWPGYLHACCADATGLAAAMARAGFETRAFYNLDANIPRLRRELEEAAVRLESGDSLVLTFSGHGARESGWSLLGYQESLCFYNGPVADLELLGALAQFTAGVRVLVILDACHSGGMDRAAGARIKSAPRFAVPRVAAPAAAGARIAPACDLVFFTACEADEVALDGEEHGAFTGAMLATLADTQSWRAWFESTQSYMGRFFPKQHPQLKAVSGSAGWIKAAIFA